MAKSEYTAAIMVIGDEILSGRTHDINTHWLAGELTLRGINVKESRVVSDTQDDIVDGLNTLRKKYDYIFTTGGIGPTHDDITADAVAAAFNTDISIHAEAKNRLAAYYAERNIEFNPARLRMARIPTGAKLIDNPISAAPGFNIENVYVMAGIPNIMREMFKTYADTLKGGAPVLSRAIIVHAGEGDIAQPLSDLQKKYQDVNFGSYPGKGETLSKHVTVVLRHSDKHLLDTAYNEAQSILSEIG